MFKKVAFQLALVLFVGLIIYSVLPGIIDFKNLVVEIYGNNAEPTNKPSVFGKVEIKPVTEATPLSPDVQDKFKNDPDKFLEFKYGWGIISIPKDEKWDYKTTPILSTIQSVDMPNSKLEIKIIKPATMPEVDQIKTFDLNSCNKENTYFQVEDNTFIGRLDYFESIEDGMYLLSFCTDAKCNEFGRICKIYM